MFWLVLVYKELPRTVRLIKMAILQSFLNYSAFYILSIIKISSVSTINLVSLAWAYKGLGRGSVILYYTIYLTVHNLKYHLACSTPTIVSGVRLETVSFVVI